ncbi:hypothetical protein VSR69_27210 [Paraburkholderia phytofirmans]
MDRVTAAIRFLYKRAKAVISMSALAAAALAAVHFLQGQVIVSFSKSLASGYEFTVLNDSQVSQTIESLRVMPKLGSTVVAVTTSKMYLRETSDGAELPYGNTSMVPAADFRDMDGQILRPQQRITFRVPPLVDWDKLKPEASLVDVTYQTEPTNFLLSLTARLAEGLTLMKLRFTNTYLVINDYWTPTNSSDTKAALAHACSEDVSLRQGALCD